MASLVVLAIVSVHLLDDFFMLPVAVPNAIIGSLVFLFIHGTSSVRYMPEDIEYSRPIVCFGRFVGLILFCWEFYNCGLCYDQNMYYCLVIMCLTHFQFLN